MDGRFKKNASHIEIRNDLTKCVVVCVEMCSKGSKAALGYWKTKKRAARQKGEIYDILTDEVEIPVEPAKPPNMRCQLQDTNAESISVKGRESGDPSIERRATISGKKRKGNRSVRIS